MPTAVVANRIYFTPEDREPFKKALTYKIPARSQHEFPLVLKTYKVGQDGMMSVPVGRLDLIPEGYEVKDMRVTKPVEFPEFKGTLRPSQQEIYDDVDDNCIINAKVSFGKTYSALAIAAKLGQKTLVITHTLALRDQWATEIEKVFGFKPGIIGSGKFQVDRPIVVSNVQTLAKKTHLVKKEFGTVVLDEAHHLSASTFTKVLDSMWARYKIGLSGTITRKDGKHVLFSDFLGFKIYQPPAENFMEPIVHIYNTGFDLPPSRNWADRVTMLETDVAYQHDVAKLAALYAAAGHHVLVVGNRVEFLQNVAELIGKDAVCITGSVRTDRNELLQSIGETKKILCGTLSIFSEGISHDILSCLILATPVNNEPLLEQITGRIVRIQEGKPTPIVVDLHLKGNTGRNQANERSKFYFSKGWKVKVLT